ncbi:hypothetical protein C1Y63_00145 [Corynebacterium sp. 13CS0277]|nr:hypothetical protein C1Y63_00145 [Corynebacterium sp. 13CS0277]
MTPSATHAPGPSVSAGVYLLFALSGLCVGGAWAAYQAGNKLLVFVSGFLAALAGAAGVLWMMGAMN